MTKVYDPYTATQVENVLNQYVSQDKPVIAYIQSLRVLQGHGSLILEGRRSLNSPLTHLPMDKMVVVSQTIFQCNFLNEQSLYFG